jgi:hypothetical protein
VDKVPSRAVFFGVFRISLQVCCMEYVVLCYRASAKIAVASVVRVGGDLLSRGGFRCTRSNALEA